MPSDEGATVFTCPMHPEIRRAGPGICPICGMALEPLLVSAEIQPNRELVDMSRRFWIGAVLTIPVFVLAMGGHAAGMHLNGGVARTSVWVQLALSTPVVLWAGWPFFQRAWSSVVARQLNMFTLIGLGTGAAYAYSVVATVAPGAFPRGFREAGGVVPVYYEAAAVITVLVLLGQVLELRAREQTGDAIRAMLNLAPKTARRFEPGALEGDVPIDAIVVGDRLRVRPGDAVPVDGVVLEGRSTVDESTITGESMPVAKGAGDAVVGGTINATGSLIVRAERVGADTMLARIVALVAQAQRSRAPIQRLADTVSGYFVPGVMVVAFATFAAWAIVGPNPPLSYALVAAVSVLIIACPCALGLATPMSIGVGIAKGAGAGVLIASAEALERLEKVNVVVVDKTGTLTEGKPRVVAVNAVGETTEAELLGIAAAVERASEHPLGMAIVAAALERGIDVLDAVDFQSVTGQGVTGMVDGRNVAIGNAAFMTGTAAVSPERAAAADAFRQDGATALFVAIDAVPKGVIAIADPVRAGAAGAIRALKADGIRIVMATGDNATTAAAIARKLDIDEVRADVLPDQKYRIVEQLKGGGNIVAMAGDGVNDAPALAAADVGIAMGTGTEVAIQSAGVTLVKGDLAGIVRARSLSRATMRNIRQNLVFAFLYNAIGIPVAAGVLYPAFGLLLSPMIAALAMSFSSVSVIANALRLRRLRLGSTLEDAAASK